MVIIQGLGFTGTRLARRLLSRGIEVSAAVRGVDRFSKLSDPRLRLSEWDVMNLPNNALMAVTIPPLPEPGRTFLRNAIQASTPQRVVYVSSTGVYGDQTEIDENTPASPNDERGRARMEDEEWIAGGPWSSLILRAAAIYGPGRGVHVALRDRKSVV